MQIISHLDRTWMAVSIVLIGCLTNTLAQATELRLRLPDAKQVERTTSVDWWDFRRESAISRGPLIASNQTLTPARPPLRVLLDPGHGGHDLGAVGWFDIQEKKLVLRVAAAVKRSLESKAAATGQRIEVRLTRTNDTFIPLRERVAIANTWEADLFASIHANSSESPKPHGFEVYFLNGEASDEDARRVARAENRETTAAAKVSPIQSMLSDLQTTLHVNQSSRFAESIYSGMSKHIRPNVRGVRQGPFTVLEGTQMPAVLIEIGYVTHADEARKLTEATHISRIVRAISSALFEVIQQKTKPLGAGLRSRSAT